MTNDQNQNPVGVYPSTWLVLNTIPHCSKEQRGILQLPTMLTAIFTPSYGLNSRCSPQAANPHACSPAGGSVFRGYCVDPLAGGPGWQSKSLVIIFHYGSWHHSLLLGPLRQNKPFITCSHNQELECCAMPYTLWCLEIPKNFESKLILLPFSCLCPAL